MIWPTTPRALGRLLAEEKSLSDLLAFLCELDPSSLAQALALDSDALTVVREHPLSSSRRGRLDLAVFATSTQQPVAALELKGAAGVHGDQLERYEAWSDRFAPAPKLFYCHPDGESPDRPRWEALRLDTLFSSWQKSNHPHARWLADQVVELLRAWDEEADRTIGDCTSWYAYDTIARRTVSVLDRQLKSHQDGSEALVGPTSGGQPAFMAWRRHPTGTADAWLAVDVRSPGRGKNRGRWQVRPCVHLLPAKGRSRTDAAIEAHDLAAALVEVMAFPAITRALVTAGHGKLAKALDAGEHQGFRADPIPEALSERRAAVERGDTAPKPVIFYFDGLNRLATQFTLDVSDVTRCGLAHLVGTVLDHLVANATAHPS